MKKILVFFCLVASLASCDVTIDSHEPVNGADSSAIGFNVYVNRGVTTKAGYKGDLTTAKLENEAGGFGVFAYYGDGALYNETSKPDFMYNQPVTYNLTYEVWDYKPVKYWPNEYGTAAGSQSADRLTFFAYAPYVDVTPSTGIVTEEGETGILGMTRNIAPGDPMIRYGANFKPGQGVDLCWGVAKEAFTSSVDGSSNDVKAGEPFLNVVKPKTGDRLKFDFNHALTQLNVTVDADIDVENGETGTLATETKIYVRSVTFTGFTARGSLNLNSKAGNPAWFDMAGTGRVNRDPVIIHDGRSDGMEGVPTATDVNELPRGLNPKIIQTGEATVGVTNEKVNLFESNDDDAPIMVIPVAGVPMTVTIVYDIETEDPSLGSFLSDGSTHGISIENKITRSIKMNSADLTLVSGRKYTINLHLGLTSVKFDATVGGWDDSHSSGGGDAPISTTTLVSVSVDPTSATVETGETVATPTVTATGSDCDLTNDPNVAWSWSSGTGNVATVDATTGAITLTGTTGTEIITVSATYKGVTKSAEFIVTVNDPTPAPTVGYFRGYDVSPGILVRTKANETAEAEYSLTDGSNPLELYDYYNKADSKNKYYIQWSVLKSELGSAGDNDENIKADSDKLPDYPGGGKWTLPSGTFYTISPDPGESFEPYEILQGAWDTILFGRPKLETKVGNTTLRGGDAYALITVQKEGNNYYGLLLIRDGVTIESGILDEDCLGDSEFSDNIISFEKLATLLNIGCVFVACTGQYTGEWLEYKDNIWQQQEGKWADLPDSGYDFYGYYWASVYDKDNVGGYYYSFDTFTASAGLGHDSTPSSIQDPNKNIKIYRPIRLVKKM